MQKFKNAKLLFTITNSQSYQFFGKDQDRSYKSREHDMQNNGSLGATSGLSRSCKKLSWFVNNDLGLSVKSEKVASHCTCSLTTIGVVRLSSLAASMMPSAMTSHLMMPPKMLTKIALTCKWKSFPLFLYPKKLLNVITTVKKIKDCDVKKSGRILIRKTEYKFILVHNFCYADFMKSITFPILWILPKIQIIGITNLWISGDDLESLFDLRGRGTAADVEKVGRRPSVQLDDVHRGHREAGAVHHAPNVTVQRDVVLQVKKKTVLKLCF